MPLIVIMCVTTFAQSIAMGWLGRPSMATCAPWVRFSSISGRAPGCPLISRPMSKPSCMPRRCWAEAIRSFATLTATSTPMLEARLVHVGHHDEACADVAGDRGCHEPDRSGSRDEYVLADERE